MRSTLRQPIRRTMRFQGFLFAALLTGLVLPPGAAATGVEPATVPVGQARQVLLPPDAADKQAYFRPGGLYLSYLPPVTGPEKESAGQAPPPASRSGPSPKLAPEPAPDPPLAVALTAGGLALVADAQGGLDVIDLQVEAAPRRLGRLKKGERYHQIVTRETAETPLAYAAAARRLDIIDLSKPERPRIIGRYHPRTAIKALAVGEDVAALLTEGHLQLVSVKRPSRPRQLARLALSFPGETLALDGDVLYLAAGDQGLLVVDISDPRKPRVLKQYLTTGPVLDLALRGRTALLAGGGHGVTLIDVSDPGRPRWLGSHQQLGTVQHVRALPGGRALVANAQQQLFVLDVASPAMPSLIAALNLPQPLLDSVAHDPPLLLLNDGLARLAGDSQPPQLSNEGLDFGQGVNYGGQRRLVLRDGIAYVADWFSGIHLYDLRNPRRPRLLSSLHTPGSPKGIVVRGELAYVADDDHGLQVVDISDPLAPRIVANLATPGLAYTPFLAGDLLFLASHRGGFQIIDLYDPRSPELIVSVDTPGKAWAIQVQKDLAYVADDEAGLLIYDVLDPEKPHLLGRFAPGTAAEDVIIDGNIAYVAFFDDGLYVLDVSDPEAPKSVAHLATPGNARGLARRGNRLYIADWLAGVHVVDITSPYRARIVGSYDTEGAAWGLRVDGPYAFVADWWGGFTVLDVSRPARPRLAGSYLHADAVAQVTTRGQYAYVAKGDDGLQVFDINNPLNPTWITGVDVPAAHGVALYRDRAYVALADGIAVVDIGNPFQARLLEILRLDHPVRILRPAGSRLYAGGRSRLSLIDPESGRITPLDTSDMDAPLADMAIQGDTLYLLGSDGTLRAYAPDGPGRSRTVHRLRKDGEPRLLRAAGERLFVGLSGEGILILRRVGGRLVETGFIPLAEPLLDLQIDARRLFAVTAEKRVLAYAIGSGGEPADAWRYLTEYRTLGDIRRLHLHDDILYLAGSRDLIAIQRLPDIEVTGTRAVLPATLPTGSYDLVVRDDGGRVLATHPNALTVALPRFRQPRFTMEDLEKALRQHRAAEPPPRPSR